jgi:hypothetical protein
VAQSRELPHRGSNRASGHAADALRFVNSAVGRELNLRGVNAKVLVAGWVNVGDTVSKVKKSAATAHPV